MNRMMAIQPSAARESRLCRRAWQALNTAKPCMIATNVRMITVFGTKIRHATASSVSRMEM